MKPPPDPSPLGLAEAAVRGPVSSGSGLVSRHVRRQQAHLTASLWGLGAVGLAYLISVWLESQGWVTPLFAQTTLTCALPYSMAAVLFYRGSTLPTVDHGSLLFLSVAVPFLVTPLGFALLQQPYSRGAVLLTFSLTVLWFWVADRRMSGQQKTRLLVLGVHAQEELAALLERESPKLLQEISLERWDPVHGAPLTELLEGVDGALISADDELGQLNQLRAAHVRLYSPDAFAEMVTGRLSFKRLQEPLWMVDPRPDFDALKRLLDLCLVVLAIPIWMPVVLAIALLLRLSSRDPVLFTQKRIGRYGVPFTMIKFRTMRDIDPGNLKNNPMNSHLQKNNLDKNIFTAADDPRITPIGQFLRRSRLDELPQLFNVLVGHMSLIGPRPEQAIVVEQFVLQIPNYAYRHVVRPGLTGWAQVQQGYAADVSDSILKLRYDLYYVLHYSLVMDFLILVRTVKTVLTGFGAR
jgi:lipopolysaccharide/colanic/teichoic acid biosynthesis glycosyltransferase